MTGDVDVERSHAEPLVHCAGARASHDGADAGQELARVEGLGDVVIGAELEAHDAIGVVAARGEHHDGDVVLATDASADLEAVGAGEHHVEEHHIEPARQEPLETERAGLHRFELHAVRREVLGEQARELAVVVDEEGTHLGSWIVNLSFKMARAVRRRAWTLRKEV